MSIPRGMKPKPTALKLIDGNPGKRRLPNEPKPTVGELPGPPDFLSEDGRIEWERIAVELYRLGLLTTCDQNTLAAYCQAYGRWMQAERALARMAERDLQNSALLTQTSNGNVIQNPLVGIANKAASDMMRYASEFGLTPVARARLDVGPGEAPRSKFDGLFGT